MAAPLLARAGTRQLLLGSGLAYCWIGLFRIRRLADSVDQLAGRGIDLRPQTDTSDRFATTAK